MNDLTCIQKFALFKATVAVDLYKLLIHYITYGNKYFKKLEKIFYSILIIMCYVLSYILYICMNHICTYLYNVARVQDKEHALLTDKCNASYKNVLLLTFVLIM